MWVMVFSSAFMHLYRTAGAEHRQPAVSLVSATTLATAGVLPWLTGQTDIISNEHACLQHCRFKI